MAVRKRDVLETGTRAGIVRNTGYLHDSDPMMLLVVCEEANVGVFVLNVPIQRSEIPLSHRFKVRGAKNHMRKLRRHKRLGRPDFG